MRDVLHSVAVVADPTSCLEPVGLVASRPGARPADLLTSAASPDGGGECLDVGITTPFSAGAGLDCVAAMRAAKLRRLGPAAREELRQQGLEYVPMAFSCYGRIEEGANARVTQLARRAARRRGLADSQILERRLRQRLGVELWRRSVAVCRRCLGGGAADEDAAWEAVVEAAVAA